MREVSLASREQWPLLRRTTNLCGPRRRRKNDDDVFISTLGACAFLKGEMSR